MVEGLGVAPRIIDLPTASAVDFPGAATTHDGDHLVRQAIDVAVIGADLA